VKVVWSDTALAQLQSIHDYIAQNSEFYAKRTVDRLTNRSKQIGQFPYSGRKVPEFDTDTVREVLEGQYRIIYEITRDQINVASVVHSAFNTGWR